jgi:hypothetical protein
LKWWSSGLEISCLVLAFFLEVVSVVYIPGGSVRQGCLPLFSVCRFAAIVSLKSGHDNNSFLSQHSQLCRRIPNTHQHSHTHIHACFSDVFDSPASSTTFSSNQRRLFHDEISPPCHCAAAVAEPFPPVPNTGLIVFFFVAVFFSSCQDVVKQYPWQV